MRRRVFYAINRGALWLGGLSVLVMTLLGGADIIMTLAFHKPIHAIYEATQTLMVIVVFLGLGIVHLHRVHICVDIGYRAMPRIGKRLADLLTLLLMLFFFGALAWRGWQAAYQSWLVGEYSPGIVPFPIYPAKFALAIGATLAFSCCIFDLMRGGRFREPLDLKGRDEPGLLVD